MDTCTHVYHAPPIHWHIIKVIQINPKGKKNHPRNSPLISLWGCFQKGLIDQGRLVLNVGGSIPALGLQTEEDKESRTPASGSASCNADAVGPAASHSCCHGYRDGQDSQTVAEINPPLSCACLVFSHSNEKRNWFRNLVPRSKVTAVIILTVWFPSLGNWFAGGM